MNQSIREHTGLSRRTTLAVLACVVLAGAALRVSGIDRPFGRSIDGWTGAFYSCMARNCIELGTAVPYLNPAPHVEELIVYANHPPLVVWVVATSFLAFGESEFAARLPFLIFSLLAIVYAFRLGCRVGDSVTGLVAAICLATAPAAVVYGCQVEVVGSHVLLAVLGCTLAHFDYYERSTRGNMLRLGGWTVFLLWTDWPAAMLFFVLQVITFFRHADARARVVGWTCFGFVLLAGMVGCVQGLQ